jgi:2-polyprenyl-3-methyl-5-hydroxy-6-metoxy-1,4-benzoquinol methylase
MTALPPLAQAVSGTEAYLGKAGSYFQGMRADYVDALPDAPQAAILEIGCSEGQTGALALARGKCARYIGIELHEPSARIAATRLTEVHIGNIEEMPLEFTAASFDAVIISEVLEHLIDPWAVVARMAPLLRPGGLIFASSPNISHHRVIRSLLRGRWDLADQGVMDRTHLRWFTPATYQAMFQSAGFTIEEVRPIRPFGWKPRAFNRLTGNRWAHLFMTQISVRARKPL